jgi:hypothetical protein
MEGTDNYAQAGEETRREMVVFKDETSNASCPFGFGIICDRFPERSGGDGVVDEKKR